MTRALVIGYGNSLRTDDGLGWHAADELAADPRMAGVDVLARHQLTPDLALDVDRAALVVFVDASADQPAGEVATRPVGPSARCVARWSHHLDPAGVLALARDLYGATPRAFVVSAGVASCEPGEALSPALARVLPRVTEAVLGLVAPQG